jgi:hypothetical protein
VAGVVWVEAARCRCTGSQQPAGRVPWPGPVLSCRWAGRWSCCCSCSWPTPRVRGAGAHRGVRNGPRAAVAATGGAPRAVWHGGRWGRHRRGHPGWGRDRAGAPTYASTMPVAAWAVLTRYRWGRPSPGPGLRSVDPRGSAVDTWSRGRGRLAGSRVRHAPRHDRFRARPGLRR